MHETGCCFENDRIKLIDLLENFKSLDLLGKWNVECLDDDIVHVYTITFDHLSIDPYFPIGVLRGFGFYPEQHGFPDINIHVTLSLRNEPMRCHLFSVCCLLMIRVSYVSPLFAAPRVQSTGAFSEFPLLSSGRGTLFQVKTCLLNSPDVFGGLGTHLRFWLQSI